VTDLKIEWSKRPRVRIIVSAEANYSAYRPEQKKHPTAISAYLIQVQAAGQDADLPLAHWPV
jgi:hypothetical protein